MAAAAVVSHDRRESGGGGGGGGGGDGDGEGDGGKERETVGEGKKKEQEGTEVRRMMGKTNNVALHHPSSPSTSSSATALRSGTSQNPDVSTGPLARLFAR